MNRRMMRVIAVLAGVLLTSSPGRIFACETTTITVVPILDDRVPITQPPSNPTSFSELANAASFSTNVEMIDALNATHVGVLYFFRLSTTGWQTSLFIGGGELVGGAPGVPVFLASIGFDFGQSTSLPVPQFVSLSPIWSNGAPQTNIGLQIPAAITRSIDSVVVLSEHNGTAYGCNQPGVYSDFDRDGTDDYVVFHRSAGTWSISKSSANGTETLSRQFGRKGDYPIVGDYTGDGRPDLVLWRPKSRAWIICPSELNLDCNQPQTRTFGSSNDRAVRGDFDGDGILDLAVRSKKTGQLTFLSSVSNTIVTRQVGGKSDVPLGVAVSE